MTAPSNPGVGKSIRPNVPLNSGALVLLRDYVHDKTGLYFDESKIDILFDKISPLIAERALDSLLDYYYFLKYDPESETEWRRVFDALTVQESFFWREMDQIRVLVEEIVPQYFRDHPDQPLTIWSAACAGGEEPLTIAMALTEAGWYDRARIEIVASDASPRAIETAQNGVYRERAFRYLPPVLREKYFTFAETGAGGVSQVSGALHSKIQWQIANLMSDADLELVPNRSPVIFCRNVFIYFSESAIRRTVLAFAGQMAKPGYLFVGMAESLITITSGFKLREIGDAFVYVHS